VPDGVRDRLRRDAVRGDLDGRGQVRQRRLDRHVDARAGGRRRAGGLERVGRDVLAQGPGEAELVERGRAKPLDHTADVDDRRADLLAQLGQLPLRRLGVRVQKRAGRLGLQRQTGERRADAVVQVAAQATPFLLASEHEPLPRPLQILEKRPRVHGAAEVHRQIADQPLLGLAEHAARIAETQLTDLRAVRHQRHRLVTSVDTCEHFARCFADADVGQIELRTELGNRCLEQPIDVAGGLELGRQPRQHLVRLTPPSVHNSVHHALQTVAHRYERERCRARCQGGRPP
jgi:hypothetical protein